MKHPQQFGNNQENNDQNEDENVSRGPITQEHVLAAQSRANRAQQEAIDLRTKLEGLEALLAKTKETLAEANHRIEERDKEILKVQKETKDLGGSMVRLEERFQRLKTLQGELHQKRRELGLDKLIAETSAAAAAAKESEDAAAAAIVAASADAGEQGSSATESKTESKNDESSSPATTTTESNKPEAAAQIAAVATTTE